MARKANALTGTLESLLREMAGLNMLAFNERCVHEGDRKALVKQRPASAANPIPELRGAYLTGPDLFSPKTNIITFAGWTVSGAELVAMNEETQQRLNGLVLCLAVEAMTEYLNSVTAAACWYAPKRATLSKDSMRRYEKNRGPRAATRGTLQYYQRYFSWLGENHQDEVVKQLLALVPSLNGMAITRGGQNLFRFLKTTRLVRHCIIHGRGRISKDRLRRLSKDEQASVQLFVRSSALGGGQRILPTCSDVHDVIWRMCSLAYVLYRETSEACGMKHGYHPSV